jgi:hypothetical protein
MADAPPVLGTVPIAPTPANPAGPPIGPPPADWEQEINSLLHGINPGGAFSGGPPAGNAPAGQGATVPRDQVDTAGSGSVFGADFWHRMLLDVEVYGFLFLLVGIGLYGLFAPQIQTTIKAASKAALAA